MNAPAKVAAKKADETNDNMALWRAVETTDPRHTKKVNQRGGFTAIGANYQIMKATEQWGPLGIGWGYTASEPLFHDSLVFVSVTLWHGDRSNVFGPVHGGAEWKTNKGHLDSDAPKKAGTDGLTKLLSQLGFNADVFLGRFDDNKYVESLHAEIDRAEKGETPKRGLDGPITSKAKLHEALCHYQREINRCGDDETLTAFIETDKDYVAFVNQCERDAPHYLHGGDPAPPEFVGLFDRIKQMRDEFQLENAQ